MGILNYRKYARVEVHLPIHLVLQGQEAEAFLSNLSEEGSNLIAEKAIPVGTTMEFDMELPGTDQPTHVRADVLWTRSVQEEGKAMYAHGLLYNRIFPEDRSRLHAFINNAMSY